MEIQEGEEGTDSTGEKIYGGINFSAVRREFKEEVQQLWRVQNWKQVTKHFFIALVFGALGSFVDIGTDGLSAKNFINGANYTKRITNLSDPANHENCVRTGFFTSVDPVLGPKVEYEEIVCFEKDLVWGWVTLGLMFVPPGLIMAMDGARLIFERKGIKIFELSFRQVLISLDFGIVTFIFAF